ncbi:alpha/beta-hydrolase family protein [Nocardia sp. NPDC024068]|uniref:alpha/beta-hydrolase family protein n=1 Tax=Nocardia sp. NPDC024068 TaxID=3157197 RepID=UPI0033E8EACE
MSVLTVDRAPDRLRAKAAMHPARTWLPREWPPVRATLAVGAGTVVSLTPGLLPRSAAVQAALTALLVAVALGLAYGLRSVARRIPPGLPRPVLSRPLIAAGTGAAVLAAVAYANEWQNSLRAAMGGAPVPPWYWPLWAICALLLTAGPATAVTGTRWVLHRLGWSRVLVTAVVAALPATLLGIPAVAGPGGPVESGLVRPVTPTRSGSAESLVSWASLGREGQRFVTSGPPGAVQVYVGLDSAPDPAARAALAVRELVRTGGFDRAHLVVAVPTGSGWVDARALQGLGTRFGTDMAVVALQYSGLPSWATFLLGRDSAATSARALFAAIEAHSATLPDPPRLYLYGQSLGAFGGSAVFAGSAEQNRRACATLWAGIPGGGGPEPGARTAILANTSDPVVSWSLDLLWRPPDLTGARRDAPTPPWLPVASFVQTTTDLLGALGAPPGHGHRYGTDQGTAMPSCDPER